MPDPTLPNLIIAGVNKAGTTSLYAYLAQHPAIGASAIKETCHFLPLRYGEPMPGIEDYREQFKAVTDKPVRFESTPGYFYGGQRLINGLRESLGDDLKIILIFREPVSRLVSFFNFKKSTLELRDDLTLAEYFSVCQRLKGEDLVRRIKNHKFGLEGGKYADYLPPWIDTFGDRLKILFTDELNGHPRQVLREVCTFVGVDPGFAEHIDLARSNKSTHFRLAGVQRLALSMNKAGERFWRSHPKLKRSLRDLYYKINGRPFEPADDPETIEALHAFYAPYNARLAEQLRAAGYRDLPDWLVPQPTGSRA